MRVQPTLKEQYVATGQVRMALSPIVDPGPGSLSSQIAARGAGQQAPPNFWRMHDALFANQSTIYRAPATDFFVDLASGLGMDGGARRVCMEKPETAATVTRLDQARRPAGIRIRPSFDVNGEILQCGVPLAQFQQVIAGKLGEQGERRGVGSRQSAVGRYEIIPIRTQIGSKRDQRRNFR